VLGSPEEVQAALLAAALLVVQAAKLAAALLVQLVLQLPMVPVL
jgi:hypothetical protein